MVAVTDLVSAAGTGSMTEGTRGTLAARAMEADRLAEQRVAEAARAKAAADAAAQAPKEEAE